MDIPFIFIHLGTDPEYFPHYVNDAVTQCRKWNKENTIYFISSKCFEKYFNLSENIIHIFIEGIEISEKHKIFQNSTRLDNTYKGGFWRLTTERLFVLEDFCLQFNINEFYHLENDNMMYFSSNELINLFRQTTNGIASTTHGKNNVIFGLLYCNNLEILYKLTEFYLINNTGENEMLVAKKFFNKYRDNTTYLPTVPISKTDIVLSDLEYQIYLSNIELFNGIFDPAQYGQWLGGVDPRNAESRPFLFVNENPDNENIKVDKFQYEKETINSLERYIAINKNKTSYPIYLLHIHSKNLINFIS